MNQSFTFQAVQSNGVVLTVVSSGSDESRARRRALYKCYELGVQPRRLVLVGGRPEPGPKRRKK